MPLLVITLMSLMLALSEGIQVNTIAVTGKPVTFSIMTSGCSGGCASFDGLMLSPAFVWQIWLQVRMIGSALIPSHVTRLTSSESLAGSHACFDMLAPLPATAGAIGSVVTAEDGSVLLILLKP